MKEEMKRLNYKIGSLICADSRAQNSYVNVIVLPYRVLDMKDGKKKHTFHFMNKQSIHDGTHTKSLKFTY